MHCGTPPSRRRDAVPGLPMLEVGSYCGRSTIWLGDAAERTGTVAVRRRPPPWLGGEPGGVGSPRPRRRRPADRQDGHAAVLPRRDPRCRTRGTRCVAIVGRSPIVAANWTTPLSFLFIDGGHGEEPARLDYEGWTPHVAVGGTLAIHDVFPDPADGGRPPYEQIFVPALESGGSGCSRRPVRCACCSGSTDRTGHGCPVSGSRRVRTRCGGLRGRRRSCCAPSTAACRDRRPSCPRCRPASSTRTSALA